MMGGPGRMPKTDDQDEEDSSRILHGKVTTSGDCGCAALVNDDEISESPTMVLDPSRLHSESWFSLFALAKVGRPRAPNVSPVSLRLRGVVRRRFGGKFLDAKEGVEETSQTQGDLQMEIFAGTVSSISVTTFVHDLPQLYQKPTAASLLKALAILSLIPQTFSQDQPAQSPSRSIAEQGVPRYLTTIISSPLSWLPSQDDRDAIYAAASTRLAERSGRTALPSLTRVFAVADDLQIALHEPSMTEDNLGLKTWTSSLLLAKRLAALKGHLPALEEGRSRPRVLELGAGTGLVGIAAACLWEADVTLTDLPEILENLVKNVKLNGTLIKRFGGSGYARALDWSDTSQLPSSKAEKFPVILAADPLYSPDHPKMLAETVGRWLSRTTEARFVIELPLRGGYDQEREELKQRLRDEGLEVDMEGVENGFDDWQGRDGNPTEVRCAWNVWRLLR